MMDWLLKASGKNSGQNQEKTELITLRKEIAKLKKKFDNNDEEMDVVSQEESVNYNIN
jgi:hypothetical protein